MPCVKGRESGTIPGDGFDAEKQNCVINWLILAFESEEIEMRKSMQPKCVGLHE